MSRILKPEKVITKTENIIRREKYMIHVQDSRCGKDTEINRNVTITGKSKRWFKWRIVSVVRSFDGHITFWRITIYGRNAMHWAVNIRMSEGYLCFRLPFRCFGKWWPLYVYYSVDGTPNCASWIFGKA